MKLLCSSRSGFAGVEGGVGCLSPKVLWAMCLSFLWLGCDESFNLVVKTLECRVLGTSGIQDVFGSLDCALDAA